MTMEELNEIFENDKEIERNHVKSINLHDITDPVFQEEHNSRERYCFSFSNIVLQPITVDQPPQFILGLPGPSLSSSRTQSCLVCS